MRVGILVSVAVTECRCSWWLTTTFEITGAACQWTGMEQRQFVDAVQFAAMAGIECWLFAIAAFQWLEGSDLGRLERGHVQSPSVFGGTVLRGTD